MNIKKQKNKNQKKIECNNKNRKIKKFQYTMSSEKYKKLEK